MFLKYVTAIILTMDWCI